ncbi:MAG: hypothetical protein ABF876_17900 [Acetobacter aceti]
MADVTEPALTKAAESAQRAEDAYRALAAAETFAAASRAWEDFLIHWKRGLNRCDGEGKRRYRGKVYVTSKARVTADPRLDYLRVARNTDEHGLAEIVGLQKKAIAIGALGGYESTEPERGPNGEWTIRFTSLTDDPPPFLAILPEHIELKAVNDGRKTIPVPPGYDYVAGETCAPVALAKYGLDFLFSEIDNLASHEREQNQ